MKRKTFCTAINCMDGRVQEPVIRYLKDLTDANFVDMITLPGPEKVLAGAGEEKEKNRIRECIAISVEKHGSTLIGIFAHDDCAGNPVGEEIKSGQVTDAVKLVRSWFPEIEVKGYFIDKNWMVQPVVPG